MPDIVRVEMGAHQEKIRELFGEYLASLDPLFKQDFDISFDMNSILERNMEELHKFMPPQGRILLAYADDGHLAGCACLRRISQDLGEIKRMFVRSQYRRKGIGRALVEAIIAEARSNGCTRLRLDSAPFLPESHSLYRSIGFKPIPPYADSEIPEEFHSRWIFMELRLDNTQE
jgi:GNAT superfamily N-acetyltransferase